MNNIINEDLKMAMKNKDTFKLSVLRMLKSALQLEKIAKKQELTDEEIQNVIKKQVKIRKDSVVEYQKYNKNDLVESLEQEIAILGAYLPEEMSESEIREIILKVIAKENPTGMKDMGKIMKAINEELKGKNADMSIVSKIAKGELTNRN